MLLGDFVHWKQGRGELVDAEVHRTLRVVLRSWVEEPLVFHPESLTVASCCLAIRYLSRFGYATPDSQLLSPLLY